ncbi:MAG: cytosine permease [Lachnospiraceae bacterium]
MLLRNKLNPYRKEKWVKSSNFNRKNGTSNSDYGIYEYAFTPVPKNKRRKSIDLWYVLTGYTSALSCLVIGAKIGASMPFLQAVLACFLGDLVLIFIGTSMGILSSKYGWSTTFLTRSILGKHTSIIFSLLIIICSVFWIGINGTLFTNMLVSVFPTWPFPTAVTSLLIIALWGALAANGWKALELVSKILVPASLILLFYTMFQLFSRLGGIEFLWEKPVAAPMSLAAASTAIIGNYVFGCMITPDTCRFAESKKSVAIVCPSAYTIGLFLFNICGVVVAKAGGFSDFIRSTVAIGLIVPMLLCSICCLVTTQNINSYGGGLALQNIFRGTKLEGNISHKLTVYLIAGFAAALSVSGVGQHMIAVVSSFSIFMVPFLGMLLAQAIVFSPRGQTIKKQGYSILVWLAGSLFGIFLLRSGVAVAPLWEIIFSGVLYCLVYRRHILHPQ